MATSASVKISVWKVYRVEIRQFKKHFIGWSSSWSSSLSSSTFQTGTFLRQPTRPKLDSAACARTLNHLCISHTPQSEMDGNVFSIFPRVYFSCFSIVFLTGLQSYISTIVFQSPPLSQWGRIAHRIIFKIRKDFFVSFPEKTDWFCQNCCLCLWFALSLWTSSQPDSEASLQTNNSLSTCVFVSPNRICWSDSPMSEPGAPALTCPCALHHHPCAVSQRLSPTDVLHRLQHLVERQGWGWQQGESGSSSSPQSQPTWASVRRSSARAWSPPFATCSTA